MTEEQRWLEEDENPNKEIVPILSSIVYVYEAADGSPLYIGTSKNGMARAFSNNYGASSRERRRSALAAAATVRIMPFQSDDVARSVEAELIHTYHPSGNGVCSECKHYFRSL